MNGLGIGGDHGAARWGLGAIVALALTLAAPAALRAESRVNINEATAQELTSLPGVGPARARAIIERREEAPFDSADELTDVPGIGEAMVEKLRDHVAVTRTERQVTNEKRRE